MGIVKRRAGGIGVPAGSGSSSSSNSLTDLDFAGSVVKGGSSPSISIDLSTGFNHVFQVAESILVTSAGWVEGASFTIDLINDTNTVHGVSCGKCVLSDDGSQQYFQIAFVGAGGSV